VYASHRCRPRLRNNGAPELRRACNSQKQFCIGARSTRCSRISDQRFKENIATTTYGLDLLARIPILDFNLIGDPDHRQQGFIAQELYKYYPDAVRVGGDNAFQNPWLVDYGRITPLLAKAIQDLNLKLEDLATTTPDIAAAHSPSSSLQR
jgi:hypothetical protein